METKQTLTVFIREVYPQVWERWEEKKLARKRERARLSMRSRYVPTGKNPGRPKIDEVKNPDQPEQM